jgi:hypothetical protein
VRPVDPVWPNAPKAEAFLPLVLMLVVVLPWIHLRAHAEMKPSLAASGLRALDLIEGPDGERLRDDRATPPLPVWAQAVVLSLRTPDKSLAVASPSALFAILSGIVLYRLGSVWYSPAVGVLAALMLICNRTLLEQIRAGEPAPIVLFFTLASLWPFAEHVRRQADVFSRWTLIGAVALAGLYLTAGAYAFSMAILGLGAMFFRGGDEDDSIFVRIRKSIFDPTTRAGFVTLILGTALAAPWLARAPWQWGPWFPWESPNLVPEKPLDWWDAIASAPALIVLAVFGFLRSVRELARLGPSAGRDALPILWTILAAIAFGTLQRTPAALLVLTAPMILLASRTILDVLERKINGREVLLLAAASVSVFVLWQTDGFAGLLHKVRSDLKLSGRDGFVFLRAAAGVFATLLVLTILYRWTRNSDSRRRALFGGLILAIIVVACAPGVLLLREKPRSEDPWYQIQTRLARLIAKENPDVVMFLDSDAASNSRRSDARTAVLEFFVRTLAPWQERLFVADPEELEGKLAGHEHPLIVATQTGRRLPKIYSLAHGSKVLTLTERLDTDRVTLYSPLAVGTTD